MSHLKQSILQEYHGDPESAIEAVKTGQAYGAIYFNANFSIAMVGRMALGSCLRSELIHRIYPVK